MTKKITSILLALVFCLSLTALASASDIADTPEGDILDAAAYLISDRADLLSDAEEKELSGKLYELSERFAAEIVIVTVPDIDGSVDYYLEDYYDSMQIGYGKNRDGVLLLVCMDPREYRILSNGYAGTAIDENDIEAIGDMIVSDLTAGNYATAFDKFADECEYYLDGYQNGFPFKFGKNLLICLIIGFGVAFIVVMIMKGQLKSVRKQERANVYVKTGSMQVTQRNDIFLYRNVTRVKKETSRSSGSGGSSRSTGGGSF